MIQASPSGPHTHMDPLAGQVECVSKLQHTGPDSHGGVVMNDDAERLPIARDGAVESNSYVYLSVNKSTFIGLKAHSVPRLGPFQDWPHKQLLGTTTRLISHETATVPSQLFSCHCGLDFCARSGPLGDPKRAIYV